MNSIPNEVWMDVDLRSESPQQLNKLADEFIKQVNAAADDENRARSTNQGTDLRGSKSYRRTSLRNHRRGFSDRETGGRGR